jgi:hypothetical protein
VNCPSMDVSQEGQWRRVTVNSERQTGQRVGAAYMKDLLKLDDQTEEGL